VKNGPSARVVGDDPPTRSADVIPFDREPRDG
jgi:hypothetical protein